MSYRFHDAEETAKLLPYGRLRDEIAAVYDDHAEGRLSLEERVVLPLRAGTLLAMPASDLRLSITKVVTVHPGNAARGLPTISGEVIVARADDGTRLGLLHGGTVTRRRTAAVSLLAARRLGVEERALTAAPGAPARAMVLFGAGEQGRGHAEAFVEELGVERVTVVGRDPDHAAALAADLRGSGIDAVSLTDDRAAVERALADSGIVVTATTSVAPVVTGGVRRDAAVFAVGAYRADMTELAPSVIGSAARVVVDTLAGATHEAGDLIQAVAAGAWDWERVEVLADLRQRADGGGSHGGQGDGRAPAHLVFKSVGHAMYDLAAARVAFPV